jgi:hypothetical protein
MWVSTNPFRDFAQFVFQICLEERDRDLSPNRLRRSPGEMQQHVSPRQIELQRHRDAALSAGRKTGHTQSEVERRVGELFDLGEKLLLWEHHAPRLSPKQLRRRKKAACWNCDPAGDYFISLWNQFPQLLQGINDLAAAYDGAAADEPPGREGEKSTPSHKITHKKRVTRVEANRIMQQAITDGDENRLKWGARDWARYVSSAVGRGANCSTSTIYNTDMWRECQGAREKAKQQRMQRNRGKRKPMHRSQA